jgi:hypothetical protein
MKLNNKDMKKYLIALLFPFIVGCSATSINQDFAKGYGLNKVSREINTELLNQNIISYEDGAKIRKIEDTTLDGLDAAWKVRLIEVDKTKTTVAKINESLVEVLTTLEKYRVK